MYEHKEIGMPKKNSQAVLKNAIKRPFKIVAKVMILQSSFVLLIHCQDI